MAHILAVDDDPAILFAIGDALEGIGHRVSVAYNGIQALRFVEQHRPDLVILDISMPELDGAEVCRRIRANPLTARLPIIFLTSKERPSDVTQGIDAGGDDFVNKTSIRAELPARVHALLRRTAGGPLDPGSDFLLAGELRLPLMRCEVEVGEQVIVLTPVEHRLLHYLMLHAGHPVSTESLLQDVWQYPPGTGDPKVVQVNVAHLWAKLEPDPENPRFIRNLKGNSYIMNG